MIKKTITYDDYNDNEVTEDFYFNLSKLEILELEVEWDGGLDGTLKRISETQDTKHAYNLFKDLLLSAYGVKSEDGRQFKKSKELRESFEQSPALSEIIIEFLHSPDDAASFFRDMLPSKMVAEAKALEDTEKKKPETVELPTAPPVLEDKTAPSEKKPFDQHSRADLLSMPQEQFDDLVGTTDPRKMSQPELVIAMQRKQRKIQHP